MHLSIVEREQARAGLKLESHTKKLMEGGERARSQLSLPPTIGERLGEWFEVLLTTRRMRWLGHLQGNPAKIGFRATPCEKMYNLKITI